MNPNNVNAPQSFVPYTGKAPVLIQIVGGLLWIGAAGLIIIGLLSMVLSPIASIIYIVLAVLFVLTARSMFKMRKVAFIYGLVTSVLLIVAGGYVVFNSPSAHYSILITPIALLVVTLAYKQKMVN